MKEPSMFQNVRFSHKNLVCVPFPSLSTLVDDMKKKKDVFLVTPTAVLDHATGPARTNLGKLVLVCQLAHVFKRPMQVFAVFLYSCLQVALTYSAGLWQKM